MILIFRRSPVVRLSLLLIPLPQPQTFSSANPAELQGHPVNARESDGFIEFIRRDSPDVDITYWKLLYEIET